MNEKLCEPVIAQCCLFITSLRISEYNWFSDVFWCCKKATLTSNGLKNTVLKTLIKVYIKKRLCSNRLMKKICFRMLSSTIAFDSVDSC